MERQVFESLKVLDFTWVVAGPLITKYLADHGATVVRIESTTRPDPSRLSAPFKDGVAGSNRSGHHAFIKTNSYSMTLNLNHPKGLEVAKKLVLWADVVAENFAPGRMAKWRLSYEYLKKLKPDIIMVSCSNQGQTGPQAMRPGMGLQLTGLSGFTSITGWPDREIVQPFGAYTDFIAPSFAAASLIAALDYRQRTGKGQYLDISQLEASIHFLAPLCLDYLVNGTVAKQAGNSCQYAVPHGAYRCRGEDRWCVIAVHNDEEWEAFCKVIGNPSLASEPKFGTLMERKRHEEELNQLTEEWTVNYTTEEVMVMMQEAGVPAGVVATAEDLLRGQQLRQRNHFWVMNHEELGPFPHLGQSFILSETPAQGRMPAALLGEHTEWVCRELLGLSDDEFVNLLNDGAFE